MSSDSPNSSPRQQHEQRKQQELFPSAARTRTGMPSHQQLSPVAEGNARRRQGMSDAETSEYYLNLLRQGLLRGMESWTGDRSAIGLTSLAGRVDDARSNASSSPGLSSDRSHSPGMLQASSDAGSVSHDPAAGTGVHFTSNAQSPQQPHPGATATPPPQQMHLTHMLTQPGGAYGNLALLTPATPTSFQSLGASSGGPLSHHRPAGPGALNIGDVFTGSDSGMSGLTAGGQSSPMSGGGDQGRASTPGALTHPGPGVGASLNLANPYENFLVANSLRRPPVPSSSSLASPSSSSLIRPSSFSAFQSIDSPSSGASEPLDQGTPPSAEMADFNPVEAYLGPSGDYGFKLIPWDDEERRGHPVSKGVAFTYSGKTNTLYVRRVQPCLFTFGVEKRVPKEAGFSLFLNIRVEFCEADYREETATMAPYPERCPLHVHQMQAERKHHWNKQRHHCLSTNDLCSYVNRNDYVELRLPFVSNVGRPHSSTVMNYTEQLIFTCYNSCSTIRRRGTKLVCSLIRVPSNDVAGPNVEVLGRSEVLVRVCACPGRDRPHVEGPNARGVTIIPGKVDEPASKRSKPSTASANTAETDSDGMYVINRKIRSQRNYRLIKGFIDLLESEDDVAAAAAGTDPAAPQPPSSPSADKHTSTSADAAAASGAEQSHQTLDEGSASSSSSTTAD